MFSSYLYLNKFLFPVLDCQLSSGKGDHVGLYGSLGDGLSRTHCWEEKTPECYSNRRTVRRERQKYIKIYSFVLSIGANKYSR